MDRIIAVDFDLNQETNLTNIDKKQVIDFDLNQETHSANVEKKQVLDMAECFAETPDITESKEFAFKHIGFSQCVGDFDLNQETSLNKQRKNSIDFDLNNFENKPLLRKICIDETKYIRLSEVYNRICKRIDAIDFEHMLPDIKLIKINSIYCFEYKDNRKKYLDNICNRIEQIYYERSLTNPYDRIDYYISTKYGEILPQKYPVLFREFKDFAYAKITNSQKNTKNALYRLSGELVHTFEYLLMKIECAGKDIDYFTIENIEEIISSDDAKVNHLKNIIHFINYLKDKEIIKIKDCITVKRYANLKNDNDFYTLEEWNTFIKNALDIDRHIKNAMNNVVYARFWLFLLLHLCLAWRRSDILALPKLDNLSDIEKYDLNWFCNNAFTAKDAVYIINSTKLMAEQYLTQKTKTEKHFIIPMSFQIPVAIAIIIVENWRRLLDKDTLFADTKCHNIDMAKYLGNEVSTFSSLKANRSLLSFMDKTAEEVGAEQYIKITSYMRSHKINYYNFSADGKLNFASNITSQYLHANYSEKELNEMLIHLYDRGPFGWLYDSLINISSDRNSKQMHEKTDLIVKVKDSLSAKNIEEIADCIRSQNLKKENVINELLKLSKEEIKEKIIKLADNHLYSRQNDICCITDKCKYPLKFECLDCEYSIPTMHTLLSVLSELNNIFLNIEQNPPRYEHDRIRTIDKMLKLFSIIKEAREALGMEYVDAYVNFIELKNNITVSFKNLTEKGDNNNEKQE